MEVIKAYCDGGCRGNQFDENIGGWGFYLIFNGNQIRRHGGTANTTNNIMELQSCIEALKQVKNKSIPIEVIMDSQYVISGMNDWIHGWIKKGWKNSKNKTVENLELWKELLALSKEYSNIKFLKCKGHSDDEGNNEADRLANVGMDEFKG